jgi:hypothetical protein
MGGAQGTGAQTCQVGVIPFTEPMDDGDPCFGREDVIGEDGRLRAEGMPGVWITHIMTGGSTPHRDQASKRCF